MHPDDTPPYGMVRPLFARNAPIAPLSTASVMNIQRSLTRDLLEDLYEIADDALLMATMSDFAGAIEQLNELVRRFEDVLDVDDDTWHPSEGGAL
jgi:hypothetical protein